MARRTIVIVGAGQAGGRAAGALRQLGDDSRIVLIGDEPHPPYERPPLSKEVLTLGRDPLQASLFAPAWYAENDVELRLGETVTALDPSTSRVSVGGAVLAFDELVLATGTRARALPGVSPDGQAIFALRTAQDARRLAPALRAGQRVLLLGGGFIGLELASSARRNGCSVTVWEAQSRLLQRSLTAPIAEALLRRHRQAGVDVVCNVTFDGLQRSATGLLATANDGRRCEADVVVVGVGAVPNAELAWHAGLACGEGGPGGGVLVDEHCRSSVANIHAIGDVATSHSAFYGHRLRLESWENAEHQGQAVAHALTGGTLAPLAVPWFWTDQQGDNWQLLGQPAAVDRTLVRGHVDDRSFVALGLAAGRVVSAVMCNQPKARRPLKKLIETAAVVHADRVVDPDIPLESMA